ncbi:24907_t:CDS:2 [Gigaspora margarita]|uniref:24907_t:CDS:1 n=1 Tax=Gigaspora margarita TaxID=4874 RepID=A0ABN7UP40_GIGMA|nr:24907_t:CDS:2 [Gigaspora margarita]
MFTLRNSRHNLDLELGQELDDSDYNDNSSENIYSRDEFNTDSQELDDSDYNNSSRKYIW